ncbi:hypothetical protein ACFXKG_18480 [Streptomyces sp. NPDC059255]|uniref:hypothetical protein n=1 Tax=Streptomyces sp. NPDC059255 TaxID=3346793 RepID=UPI00367BDAB6
MTKSDDDHAALKQRFANSMDNPRLRILTPITSRNSAWTARTGLSWWLGYALHEPREFAYVTPRRIACRVLGRHNPTCIGRPAPHPRRW